MNIDVGLHPACSKGNVDHGPHALTVRDHFTTASCGGWGIDAGDHVTIGRAKTVWLVTHVWSEDVEVVRVNDAGKFLRRSRARGRVHVVGRHRLRRPAEITRSHCLECGCYREIAGAAR